MIVRIGLIFLLCFGGFHLVACHQPSSKGNEDSSQVRSDTGYRNVKFDSAILIVDKKCESCETWDALFALSEFINLYEHSSFYVNDAIAFLSQSKYNDHQKKVAICSMQRSSLADYLRVLEQCKILFDSGNLSEDLLQWAIAPNFSKRHLIVRNFDNEDVKKALTEVQNDKMVSKRLKDLVESILTGKLWSNIKEIEGQ